MTVIIVLTKHLLSEFDKLLLRSFNAQKWKLYPLIVATIIIIIIFIILISPIQHITFPYFLIKEPLNIFLPF